MNNKQINWTNLGHEILRKNKNSEQKWTTNELMIIIRWPDNWTSDNWTSDNWTSDNWTSGQLNQWTIEPVDNGTSGQLNQWTIEPVDNWASGQLNQWQLNQVKKVRLKRLG